MYRHILQSSLVLAALMAAAPAYARPRGYGIVAKINQREQTEITDAKRPENAHITAIQSWFDWSELEPQDDQFDFSRIADWLDTLAEGAYPKRAVLVIMPINGKNPAKADHWNNTATPAWLLDRLAAESPAGIVSYVNNYSHGGGATVRYPIFWNQTYQDEFEELLNQLPGFLAVSRTPPAAFPDRLSQIEYIRVTGYSVETTEPSFYNTATVALMPSLASAGVTFIGNKPRLRWKTSACLEEDPHCRKYSQATCAFWDMWIAIFPDVPLAVTARFSDDTSIPSYDYYLKYKQNIDNNFGLGSTTDVILNTAWQTKTCEMATLRTNLAALQTSTLKVGFGDVHCSIPFTDPNSQCCMKYDLAREGIGITGSGLYSPRSLASYLTLGSDRWPNPAGTAVWSWADGQLGAYSGATPTNCDPSCSDLSCGDPSDTCNTPDENNERDDGVD